MVNSTAKRGAFHLPCFSCFQYLIFALPHLSHILIPFSQVGHSRCPRRVEGALQRRGAQEQVALLRCRGQLEEFITGSAFWNTGIKTTGGQLAFHLSQGGKVVLACATCSS